MHFERWRKLKPGHVALLKRSFRDAIVINVRRSGVPQSHQKTPMPRGIRWRSDSEGRRTTVIIFFNE
ncbi:hypothetical protein B9Z55_015709 [Caenorhabditis nigoni]|uniref:Uncharacterized protein n=1 Tax=Caenorhabditis nigoni TaxID=1611254 RepID=A0A2G5UBQ5_9PELO|nr:hypothetical protein B9Z55_015709 [Caenorhabditis nigoni]